MALNIPLPDPDKLGDGFWRAYNSIMQDDAKTKEAQLKNQYYAPNITSEINQRNALTQGQNIANQYAPEKNRLANAFQALQNQYYGPNIQSEMAERNALTNKYNTMTPLEAQKQSMENQYYPEKIKADIAAQNATANYRNMGGGSGGVGTKEMMALQSQLMREGMDAQTANQAASAYLSGESQLPDGRPLPSPSGIVKSYVDQIAKRGTTAALITSSNRANAAQAEMPVLDKYITQGRSHYGTTVFGKSPQQIKDSLDTNNPEAQQRLGDYIASDVLSFDKAALQTRIAGTESGVTIINEVMNKAKQTIDAKYPMLSDAARQRALEQVGTALTEALDARNKYGIGASGATGKKVTNSGKATLRYNQETGDFEEIK